MPGLSPRTLARKILAPGRPRLAEARAIVAPHESPEGAWRALGESGLLPPAWMAPSARRFRGPGGLSRWPATARGCALVASDVAGAAEAERQAFEVAARLEPWGLEPVSAIEWELGHPRAQVLPELPTDRVEDAGQEVLCLVEKDQDILEEFGHKSALLVTSVGYPVPLEEVEGQGMMEDLAHWYTYPASQHLFFSLCWGQAVANGAVFPAKPGWATSPRARVAGRPIAEFRDPFAALLDLWATGYGLLRLGGGVAVLASPRPRRPRQG